MSAEDSRGSGRGFITRASRLSRTHFLPPNPDKAPRQTATATAMETTEGEHSQQTAATADTNVSPSPPLHPLSSPWTPSGLRSRVPPPLRYMLDFLSATFDFYQSITLKVTWIFSPKSWYLGREWCDFSVGVEWIECHFFFSWKSFFLISYLSAWNFKNLIIVWPSVKLFLSFLFFLFDSWFYEYLRLARLRLIDCKIFPCDTLIETSRCSFFVGN